MAEAHGRHVVVFAAGALGDFVLTWPLLRALVRSGMAVTVVARESHAKLAERVLGVRAVSEDRHEVWGLWSDNSITEHERDAWAALLGRGRVVAAVSFVADPASELGTRWSNNARLALGAHEVWYGGAPGTLARKLLWDRMRVAALGGVPRASRSDGRPVVHIGAGSRSKVWPIENWCDLVARDERLRGALVLGGEVEEEQMTSAAWRAFKTMGGHSLASLDALLDALGWRDGAAGSRLFIGADTGPTHLAAQLGIATLALFGPTDPAVWAPVGPHVQVVRAETRDMQALTVERVQLGLTELLGSA